MQVYYLLKCKCKWWRKCLGTSADFKDLVEFKPCVNCHGPRKYKCPKCGSIMKAMRVEGPDPPEMKEEPTPVTPAAPVWTPPPDFIPTGGLAPIDESTRRPDPVPEPPPAAPEPVPPSPSETPPAPEPTDTKKKRKTKTPVVEPSVPDSELAKELGRMIARRLRGEK